MQGAPLREETARDFSGGPERHTGVSRQRVLAVSNSDQHRETLLIILDGEFDVRAVDTVTASTPGGAPAAVVLSPTRWDAALAADAQSTWPTAALVLMDPPAPVSEAFRTAAVGSWSDPISLRGTVHRAMTANALLRCCADLERLLTRDLRRHLDVSKALADLAAAVALPASVYVSTRMLGEQLAALLDRLIWLDDLPDGPRPAVLEEDLGTILARHIDACEARLHRRGLLVEWHGRAPMAVRATPRWGHLIARCVWSALLDLSPGPLRVTIENKNATCEHAELGQDTAPLPLIVADRLLSCARMSAQLEPGRLSICAGDS